MPLNLSVPTSAELKPKIVVIGVGGAGGNAVNNMIESCLDGVSFVCANTDAQAVGLSHAETKIQLGTGVTQGLGAGSRPQIGEAAAEESLDEVMAALEGANMLFITAGMGGGTGTGAAPVIAKAARDMGILTVGVVTKPFAFEGQRRMRIAEEGIEELSRHVDTLLIIPNQNLFRLADENTTFADAFGMADEVLYAGVRGITDLMIVPGHINLDFADVRTVMSEMGKAMMGTGESSGDDRASVAAAAAISNPLLDEMSLKGAKGVLINITGGLDMKLFEVDEAANAIRAEVDPDANIIVGSTFDQSLEGTIRVSVVATGIDGQEITTTTEFRKPTTTAQPAPQPAPVAELPTQPRPAPQPAPAPQPVPTPVPDAASASTDPNPVGDVHERIRRMLTEDAAPARDDVRHAAQARQNPFRGKQTSTLEAAMGILRDTFKGKEEQPQAKLPPRRVPSAKPLTDDDDEVEVPAFLRRN